MNQTYAIGHHNADLLAYILDGIFRIKHEVRASRKESGADTLSEEIGTMEDRLYRASVMIAARLVTMMEPIVESAHEGGCGVFVYDYCDFGASGQSRSDCMSLPAFLWRWLEKNPEHWLSAAESLREYEIPLKDVLADWCVAVDIAIKVPEAA